MAKRTPKQLRQPIRPDYQAKLVRDFEEGALEVFRAYLIDPDNWQDEEIDRIAVAGAFLDKPRAVRRLIVRAAKVLTRGNIVRSFLSSSAPDAEKKALNHMMILAAEAQALYTNRRSLEATASRTIKRDEVYMADEFMALVAKYRGPAYPTYEALRKKVEEELQKIEPRELRRRRKNLAPITVCWDRVRNACKKLDGILLK
jgi:hypothetical protein